MSDLRDRAAVLIQALAEVTGREVEDFAHEDFPFTAEVEQDGCDWPGWRLEVGRTTFGLTYELGWYTQSGEGETVEDLRTLAHAFEAANHALNEVLNA